jgi:hypothetical protein
MRTSRLALVAILTVVLASPLAVEAQQARSVLARADEIIQ